jgi:hypothetical protein
MIYFDLVRSAGGWTELKAIRKTDARIKGDERILDNSDFVVNVLNAANEQLEEKYALQAGGCSIDILIEVNEIEKHKIIDVPIFFPKIYDRLLIPNSVPMLYEGALASFLNSALGFSPTLFLQLSKLSIPCMKFNSPKLYIRPLLMLSRFKELKNHCSHDNNNFILKFLRIDCSERIFFFSEQ